MPLRARLGTVWELTLRALTAVWPAVTEVLALGFFSGRASAAVLAMTLGVLACYLVLVAAPRRTLYGALGHIAAAGILAISFVQGSLALWADREIAAATVVNLAFGVLWLFTVVWGRHRCFGESQKS